MTSAAAVGLFLQTDVFTTPMLTTDSSAASMQPFDRLAPPRTPTAVSLLSGAPRVSAQHAHLTRLIGQGLQLPLRLPQSRLILRLAPEQGAAPWRQVLLLRGAAGDFHVADGARLLLALTGIDPAALPAAAGTYQPWAVAALCGRLNETPLAGMQGITVLPETAPLPPQSVALNLSLVQQGHTIQSEIRATAAHWLSWLSAMQSRRLQLPLEPYLSLSWSAPVLLACHQLPLADARQLAAGDIVLPYGGSFSTDGSGRVQIAGQHWRVRYQSPSQLQLIAQEHSVDTIETQREPELPPETEENSAPQPGSGAQESAESLVAAADGEPAAADAAMLDPVPVTLHFELGSLGLPLAQLRTLAAGTVLRLHGGVPESIHITCSGRTLGRGEVVDVDGALGIRITQWGGAC